ncbi:MAG: hypothetical protein ACSHXB_20730 [Sulfitobacter sp.]
MRPTPPVSFRPYRLAVGDFIVSKRIDNTEALYGAGQVLVMVLRDMSLERGLSNATVADRLAALSG